ncbi:MAG: YDG domain-containing protein [Candidatus Ancillula sp.]|jgi:uncharacterized protein YjbI with pentapeptide repeats|nr:YDG domain-containing protein [Candidatus Ancillula sp.]
MLLIDDDSECNSRYSFEGVLGCNNNPLLSDDILIDESSLKGSFAAKDVAASEIVNLNYLDLTGSDVKNYDLSDYDLNSSNISAANITTAANINHLFLEVKGTPNNKVYDGTVDPAVPALSGSLTLSGVISGEENKIALDSGFSFSFRDKNVGTRDLQVSGLRLIPGSDGVQKDVYNYALQSSTKTVGSAIITPADLNVSNISVIKSYDEGKDKGNSSLTCDYVTTCVFAGLQNNEKANLRMGDVGVAYAQDYKGDNIPVTFSRTENFEVYAEPNYPDFNSSNYSITINLNGIGKITGATQLKISGLSARNKTYNNNHAVVVDGEPELVGLDKEDISSISLNSTTTWTKQFIDSNVGNDVPVAISGAKLNCSGNVEDPICNKYYLPQTSYLKADIVPKEVNVDNFCTENCTPEDNAGDFWVDDKRYDGNTQAHISGSSPTVSGFISDDVDSGAISLNITNISAKFLSKDVASQSGAKVEGLKLEGSKLNNYILSDLPLSKATISMTPLKFDLIFAKSFDGTTDFGNTTLISYSIIGLIGSESVSLYMDINPDYGLSYKYSSADVSVSNTDYREVTFMNHSIAVGAGSNGYIGSNYVIDDITSGKGLIIGTDEVSYTVCNISASQKVYDGTNNGSLQIKPASGDAYGVIVSYGDGFIYNSCLGEKQIKSTKMFNSETIPEPTKEELNSNFIVDNSAVRAYFPDKNITSNNTSNNLTVSGFKVTDSSGVYGSKTVSDFKITSKVVPLDLKIKADNISKVEGTKDPRISYSFVNHCSGQSNIVGVCAGDKLSGKMSREKGEKVGKKYLITLGDLNVDDGNDGNNYTLELVNKPYLSIKESDIPQPKPTPKPNPEQKMCNIAGKYSLKADDSGCKEKSQTPDATPIINQESKEVDQQSVIQQNIMQNSLTNIANTGLSLFEILISLVSLLLFSLFLKRKYFINNKYNEL